MGGLGQPSVAVARASVALSGIRGEVAVAVLSPVASPQDVMFPTVSYLPSRPSASSFEIFHQCKGPIKVWDMAMFNRSTAGRRLTPCTITAR